MAVYTKVSKAEAAEFLAAYDLGMLVELIGIKQGVENTNYVLRTTKGRYILTLYEKRVKEEDLPFFLGLMQHLAKKGVLCPQPMVAKTSAMLGRLAGRPAALTSFLPGEMVRLITPKECGELGRGLASMHAGTVDFKMHRPNALSLQGWKKLLKDTHNRADEVRPGLADILKQEYDYLCKNWPKGLPFGVIHADLFPDNVFFKNGKLCGLIDFYFACEDFLVYDLGICFNAWCFERHVSFNITKARQLIKGYEKIRPLSKAEKAALPVLMRGSDLRFLLTRLYDWLNHVPGALVKPKDPLEYMTRLSFHQMAKGISDYGFDI
jgi:homoserine kinase type II